MGHSHLYPPNSDPLAVLIKCCWVPSFGSTWKVNLVLFVCRLSDRRKRKAASPGSRRAHQKRVMWRPALPQVQLFVSNNPAAGSHLLVPAVSLQV